MLYSGVINLICLSYPALKTGALFKNFTFSEFSELRLQADQINYS